MSRPDTAQLMFNTANLHYHSPYHPPNGISTFISIAFIKIDIGKIDKAVPSRGGIITGKIPVAGAAWHSLMQPLQALVNNLYFSLGILGVSISTILAEISSSVNGA